MLGVTDKETDVIKSVIKPFRNKYDFFCYGSRVKGDFNPLSDLDLLIKDKENEKPADCGDITSLKKSFDESLLPYVVNISDYYSIDTEFYALIKNDLTEI